MFAQQNRKYLIDSETLIAGLEGQEGSPESTCLDILWMLLEANQIEVLILAEEWDHLSHHINQKVKEPKRAEALLNRLKKNIKPIQDDKEERLKLLYFSTVLKGGNPQDLVSIEEVVTQHTSHTYSSANAAVESLVFLFSIWLTKEIFGVQMGGLEAIAPGVSDFLGGGQGRRQPLFSHPGDEESLHAVSRQAETGQAVEQDFEKMPDHKANLPILFNSGWVDRQLWQRLGHSLNAFYVLSGTHQGHDRPFLTNPNRAIAAASTAHASQNMATTPNDTAQRLANDVKFTRDYGNASEHSDHLTRFTVQNSDAEDAADEPTSKDDQTFQGISKIIQDSVLPLYLPSFAPPSHPAADVPPSEPSAAHDPVTPATPVTPTTPAVPTVPTVPLPADWVFTATYNAEGQLSLLALDTNSDGTTDWVNVYFYDESSYRVMPLADRQGDGKVNQIDLIEDNQFVAFVADTDNDAIFDVVILTVAFDQADRQQGWVQVTANNLDGWASGESAGQIGPNLLAAGIKSIDGAVSIASGSNLAADTLLQGGEVMTSPAKVLPRLISEEPVAAAKDGFLFPVFAQLSEISQPQGMQPLLMLHPVWMLSPGEAELLAALTVPGDVVVLIA